MNGVLVEFIIIVIDLYVNVDIYDFYYKGMYINFNIFDYYIN